MTVVDLGRVRHARALLDEVAARRPDLLGPGASAARWEELLEGLDMTDEAKTYGLEEVASILGVHAETVRRAIRSGELAAFKLARNYRVSKAELTRWWAAKGGGVLFEEGARSTEPAEEVKP